MESKVKRGLGLTTIMIGIVTGLFVLYILLESVVKESEHKQQAIDKFQKELIDDAFIMGAAMYRAQVVRTLDDSTITALDTLFIREVRDFNDTLAVKVHEEIE